MKIRKNSISIFLCIAMLLSLVPASAASASEGKHSFAAKTVEVTVKAVNKEDGEEVPVEDALVTITQGDSVLVSASTDAKGVARLSLEGLSADELRNATVQACKTVTTEKGISATNKDALFQNFAQDGGDYYRYEYQLHSETIDADGNPVMIEANTHGGSVWLPEIAHGRGAFGENTAEVLRWLRLMKNTRPEDRAKYAFGKGV